MKNTNRSELEEENASGVCAIDNCARPALRGQRYCKEHDDDQMEKELTHQSSGTPDPIETMLGINSRPVSQDNPTAAQTDFVAQKFELPRGNPPPRSDRDRQPSD